MRVEKLLDRRPGAIPLIAALPYAIQSEEDAQSAVTYDPQTQRPVHAGRDYSTCREDDSVGWINTKSDTRKDD